MDVMAIELFVSFGRPSLDCPAKIALYQEGIVMLDNAAKLFKKLQAEQDLQLRTKALENPTTFVRLAEEQGYRINPKSLTEDLKTLTDEAIAAIWNPGIGPRRHLIRR
jgi:hypothetical protein